MFSFLMKSVFATILIFFSFQIVFAQNFSGVDAKVLQYPSRYNNPEQLAFQITKDFTKDVDKVRALYTWLTHNIHYDLQSYYNGQTSVGFSYSSKEDFDQKLRAINNHIVKKTLISKKAVCEGYAQTFKMVSELMSIPCKLIGGFSKGDVSDIGNIPKQENHAWNAVKINNKWYLVDATWGAGYANGSRWIQHFNDFYFLTDPDKFALTHLPSETEWLFSNKTITKKQFYESPIYEKAFFTNNLKLLSPLEGELVINSNNSIEFIMAEIPNNVKLYYAFKGNKYSKRLLPSCINGKCYFKIPFKESKNTELLIFANEQTALQYKITLKN